MNKRKFGICIVVVDATDPEFTAVTRLRDLVRSTPCILVVNKIDLLPQFDDWHLRYLKARVEKGARMISAYGVSARTGEGLVELAEGVLEELGGRDVFVVGSANVGKSSLVKGLSSLLARTLRMRGKNKHADDRRRDALRNLAVTASHLPGTTLQAVRIPCFPSVKHALWDTPGIIRKSALAYGLFPSHLMEPLAYPSPIQMTKLGIGAEQSLLIEAGWVDSQDDAADDEFTLARLDVVDDGGMQVLAVAFIPSCLRVRIVPTEDAPKFSTVPPHYAARIREMVSTNIRDSDLSRPLGINKGDGETISKDGAIQFEPELDFGSGWVRKDICFSSLGWINLNHKRPFTVRPWVVQGALWSQRKPFYPSNIKIEARDESETSSDAMFSDENDEKFLEAKRRLQMAAEEGRHRADNYGRSKREEQEFSDFYRW